MSDDLPIERPEQSRMGRLLGQPVGHTPLPVDWFADGFQAQLTSQNLMLAVGKMFGLFSLVILGMWIVGSGLNLVFGSEAAWPWLLSMVVSALNWVSCVGMATTLIVGVVGWVRIQVRDVELTRHHLRIRRPNGSLLHEIPLAELELTNVAGTLCLAWPDRVLRLDATCYDPVDVARITAAIQQGIALARQPETTDDERNRKAELKRLAALVTQGGQGGLDG